MAAFEYITSTYKVPAEYGREIRFEGNRKGVITQDCGNYIGVNFDDAKPGQIEKLHPTWEVEYLETFAKIRKKSAGSQRYDDYRSEDPGVPFIEWLKNRSKKSAFFMVLLLVAFTSCEPVPDEEQFIYDYKIIHSKKEYNDYGSHYFDFAYTDGTFSHVDFGIYATHNNSDTVKVYRFKWDYDDPDWFVVTKN